VSRYLALAVLMFAGRAHAEPPVVSLARPERPLGYWQRVLHPERARAARLVREGNAQLAPAVALGSWPLASGLPLEFASQRAHSVEAAHMRFALALQLDPGSREAMLAQADALTLSEGEQARRAAIAAFEALRALDPLHEAEHVAFQLGLLRAQNGEAALARREYERSLALHSADARQPTQLLDLAEVTMFDGDLPRGARS